MNKIPGYSESCECCDRPIKDGQGVNLELDSWTGLYHKGGVPEDRSQGWFLFGSSCAKKMLNETSKAGVA